MGLAVKKSMMVPSYGQADLPSAVFGSRISVSWTDYSNLLFLHLDCGTRMHTMVNCRDASLFLLEQIHVECPAIDAQEPTISIFLGSTNANHELYFAKHLWLALGLSSLGKSLIIALAIPSEMLFKNLKDAIQIISEAIKSKEQI